MRDNKQKTISRRGFLKNTAGVAVTVISFPYIVPSSALGLAGTTAPSNRIAMGFIGVGSKGRHGMRNFMTCDDAQIVAICDVKPDELEKTKNTAKFPQGASVYNNFKDLLARSDIDAVYIATPDHWHVLTAIAAAKAGKDVYCEKPLSNTVAEGRALVETIKRYGTVFQHGTHLRSFRNVRFACELVRNGRIGELQSITLYDPPGKIAELHPEEPVPQGFDYNLWLGPAPYAPYTPIRVKRYKWNYISDYSKSGHIAGMGVHDIDIAQWGMDTELTGPIEIEGEGVFPKDALSDTVLTYRLEYKYANGVKIKTKNTTDINQMGVKFQGTKGWVHTRHLATKAYPESLLREVIGPNEIHLYESKLHERNFLDCVKTRAQTITPVEIAHRSTSTALIGGIAVNLGRKLRWNPDKERFINDPEANRLLSYTMRSPWRL